MSYSTLRIGLHVSWKYTYIIIRTFVWSYMWLWLIWKLHVIVIDMNVYMWLWLIWTLHVIVIDMKVTCDCRHLCDEWPHLHPGPAVVRWLWQNLSVWGWKHRILQMSGQVRKLICLPSLTVKFLLFMKLCRFQIVDNTKYLICIFIEKMWFRPKIA
jgi:hypothetical protein